MRSGRRCWRVLVAPSRIRSRSDVSKRGNHGTLSALRIQVDQRPRITDKPRGVYPLRTEMIRRIGCSRKSVAFALALLTFLTGIAPVRAGCWSRWVGLPCCCFGTNDRESTDFSPESSDPERPACCCGTDPSSSTDDDPATDPVVASEKHTCNCEARQIPAVPPEPRDMTPERSGQLLLFGPHLTSLTWVVSLSSELSNSPCPPQRPSGPQLRVLLCSWLN